MHAAISLHLTPSIDAVSSSPKNVTLKVINITFYSVDAYFRKPSVESAFMSSLRILYTQILHT